jgi:hypothetical protein
MDTVGCITSNHIIIVCNDVNNGNALVTIESSVASNSVPQ